MFRHSDTTPCASGPRVALVSIAAGKVQRGYERYFTDLFHVLRDHANLTFYKGGGTLGPAERVPPLLGLATRLARLLPLGTIADGAEYRKYKHDCLAFGLSILPALMRREFDIVHVIDYPLARVMRHLRTIFRFPARLLYTNGCCAPPQYYPRADHVHHVAEPLYLEALAAGIPASYLTLVPCGIHPGRFRSKATRSELREKHGIAESTFVVLAISAVKRPHKRIDYLIEEVSRVPGDVLLWIDGNPEDPSLPLLARRKLGDRCRITHVPSAQVAELYGLADVLAHTALEESFGLAIVEALSAGLEVLVPRTPHFRWLVQDDHFLVDMSAPGKLAERLAERVRTRQPGRCRSAGSSARFDWQTLASQYVAMYRKVAGLPQHAGNNQGECPTTPIIWNA